MADYVESGYVQKGYVASDSVTNCDLTVVNTKLDLILTKLSALSNAIVMQDVKIDDIRNTVNTELVSIQNIKDIVPMVDDTSIRIFPNGTKVNIIGVISECTIVSSHYTPASDYLYIVMYTVRDALGRVSDFSADQVQFVSS